MRALTARLIVVFIDLVTLGFNPMRRASVLARVRSGIMPVVTIRTARGQFRAYSPSRISDWLLRRFHRDEPDTLEWIDEIPENAVLWDIGANIGLFGIYAALRPDVRVLAFEPAAGSYAALNENVRLNGMDDRISAYPVALAGEAGLDVLNMGSTEAGSSFNGFGTERHQFGGTIRTSFRQGAVGFAIDDFVRLLSPPLPTHVKLDVDGIEADILRGGRETLGAPGVRSMIVEIEGAIDSAHNREILDLMDELGLRARSKGSPDYRNVIFDRLRSRTARKPDDS